MEMIETVVRDPNTGRFSTIQVPKYAPIKPEHIQEEDEGINETKVFTGAGALLYSVMFAYTHPQSIVILLIVLSSLLALYRHWYYAAPTSEPEAVTEAEEAPQPKRHWQRRLKVHDYQSGKTIRV